MRARDTGPPAGQLPDSARGTFARPSASKLMRLCLRRAEDELAPELAGFEAAAVRVGTRSNEKRSEMRGRLVPAASGSVR